MNPMTPYSARCLAATLALFLPTAAFASCGAAFCTVNTNWTSQSVLVDGSGSYDLHYESIDQDQPYAGGHAYAPGAVARHHDEVSTVNRNLVATYSTGFANGWGLALVVPIGDRDHVHLHHHEDEAVTEEWKFRELGDIRLLGRYQVASVGTALSPGKAGVILGLKLPTGRFTIANGDGDVAERSLQPGTGTLDLIVGGYVHQRYLDSDSAWFAQAQYQHPVTSRSGYAPGGQLGVDVGYRKGVGDRVGLLAQLNYLHKGRDRGSEAEPDDSGGRYLSASAGLSYTFSDRLQVYGFYQRPILRHVNGVQLTANQAFMIGLSGQL
jgi:hypothetical protein